MAIKSFIVQAPAQSDRQSSAVSILATAAELSRDL
jgi:hypothetical protein